MSGAGVDGVALDQAGMGGARMGGVSLDGAASGVREDNTAGFSGGHERVGVLTGLVMMAFTPDVHALDNFEGIAIVPASSTAVASLRGATSTGGGNSSSSSNSSGGGGGDGGGDGGGGASGSASGSSSGAGDDHMESSATATVFLVSDDNSNHK